MSVFVKNGVSPSRNCIICLVERPIKMMENAFYFILKALFILKIRLTSKFMMSQPDSQTNAILILPNISQSKGNKTITFGQLIDRNKSNIFLQK